MTGLNAEKTDRLLQGPIRALSRHVAGKTSFHASAVSRGNTAIAMLGASTSGKSTLAAKLCRSGFEMLADEATFLEEEQGGFFILPSESTHWLREDAASLFCEADKRGPKYSLPTLVAARAPVRLGLLIGLAFDERAERATLRRVDGHEAFRWLQTSLFRLVLDDREIDARDFARMASVYAATPVLELRRRRCLAEVGEDLRLVKSYLEGMSAERGSR